MKLNTIIIEVPDVATLDACRDWYEKLGLIKAPLDNPGESYWFELGAESLLGIHTGSRATGCIIWLSVPDVDAAYEHLRNTGFEFESPPTQRPFGRVAGLKDPGGIRVLLISAPQP